GAFVEFDRPATVRMLTGTVARLAVMSSTPGAWISIFVPDTLTRLKNCCEVASDGLPKLTQSSVARLKPVPRIVTTEPPSSLASEPAPPLLVEIDVIAGWGT